jgi:hypothetical protein
MRPQQATFEGDPRGLAALIEFLGHSQRFERRCDAPGRHTHQHDGGDGRLACALPFPGLLNHSQAFAGCGAVAFERAFSKLEQERHVRRDRALGCKPPVRAVCRSVSAQAT